MQFLRIICLFLFSFALTLRAQTASKTNAPNWAISMEECLEMALKSNLGVEIERMNTRIARYNLGGAYGDWDPFLSASATHAFSSTPSGFDSQGRIIPSSESRSDSVSAGLGGPGVGASGLLPSGLTYSLSGNASDTVFHRPLPQTNGTFLDSRIETSRAGVALNLRQPLLKNFWTDNTRTTILVRKNRLKYSEATLQLTTMALVNDTAKAYYDLIYARENVEVYQTALELAEKLVLENKKKVEVGTLAALDEKSAEAQAATSRGLLLGAENVRVAAENKLKRLLTGDFTAAHETQIVPTEVLTATIPILNLQESWAKGMTQRPDLLQARLDAEQEGINLRFYHNQMFPELDLVGSYGFAGTANEFSGALGRISSGSDPNYSVGVAMTIPLGNRGPRNAYEASKVRKKGLLLKLKDTEQAILAQIDNAVKTVQISFDKIQTTRQASIFAQAALDAEQKKLESGKSTPYLVLQAQRDLISARRDEIQTLTIYQEALSDLYFQEGSILDHHHLRVEVK